MMTFGTWLDFAGGHLEAYFAIVFGFIGLMALLYSISRVRGGAGQVAEYYVFVLLLIACALGTVFARDLLLLFVMWELATFALWRLVAFYRRDDDVSAAGWAWYVNFGSATLMIVGLALLMLQHHSLSLDTLHGQPISAAPAVLLFIGILAKSATLPLYVWLPRAYRAAPAPVCALLSGIAENIGVVLFLKAFVLTFQVSHGFMAFAAGLAVISSLVAGGVALNRHTVRGVLAYSTISQLGFILLGLAVAGYYGLLGALLYVGAHAVAKAGLFFAAGVVEDATGTDDLKELGGVARRAPVLSAAAAAVALSIMGIPPFLGFFAKVGVLAGAVRFSILLGVGAIAAALFTVVYLARLYVGVFLGSEPSRETRPINAFPVALVVVMAITSLAGGILYYLPIGFLLKGMSGLTGAF
jgi:formate hydrogenlyase subunit 3/multisubunit Na+/H+ antiporter MnhD subunit